MPLPKWLRSHAGWLLLVPAAAGLALLAARAVAERQAEQAAMSAELLAPFAASDPPAIADGPVRSASPEPDTSAADSGNGLAATSPPPAPAPDTVDASIVPPELAGLRLPELANAAPGEPLLDPSLFADWSTFEDAVARSRATGRPVMLAFTALGCETCESLRQSVFEDEAASVTMRSAVIPVAVHDVFADAGPEARLVDELQHDFDVTTFPTLVVWSPTTKRLRTLKGFRGAAATLRFITDAASALD